MHWHHFYTESPKLLPTPISLFDAVPAMLHDPKFFFCNATGALPMTYRWLKDGKDIGYRRLDPTMRTDLPYLKLQNLIEEDSGGYTCLVSNSFGSVNRSFRLFVQGIKHFCW